jgi:glycosyltransferase involved in cell wall biosynthesis
MKRVLVNGRFLGQRITGAQRYARELLQGIDTCLMEDGARSQFSFTVLVPENTPRPSLSAVGLRAVGRTQGHLWEQVTLPRHTADSMLLNLCNSAPLAGRNMVATILDASVYAVPEAYSPAFRIWYRVMFPIVGRRARWVITISEFSRRELQRFAGINPARSLVVPGSGEHILRIPASDAALRRLNIRSGRYILAVSSKSRHKNLSGIADALRLVGDQPFDVVLAGGGNSRVFRDGAAGLTNRIRVAGYVTDSELRGLYQHAACLLYPSLYEGFGLPPLEAMTCGCPVIASRVASLPEVCGEAAMYCDPEDPSDIARAIRAVMNDDDQRRTLRQRGLEQAARFRWSKSARSVLTLLQSFTSQ